nr:unnamed protein product [Spirometra erinaceieuropaei]
MFHRTPSASNVTQVEKLAYEILRSRPFSITDEEITSKLTWPRDAKASPSLKSVVAVESTQWNPTNTERRLASPHRHGRSRHHRSPSPLSALLPGGSNPPAPVPGLENAAVQPPNETRRVLLKRRADDAVGGGGGDAKRIHGPHDDSLNGSGYAVRSMQEFLHQSGGGPASRPRLESTILPKLPPESTLNRRETCPILIRIFYSTNGQHTPLSLFSNGKLPHPEIQVNTWLDASLRELARELRDVCPLARRKGSRLQFATVFPDSQRGGAYRRRVLGTLITGQALYNGAPGRVGDSLGPPVSGDAFVTLESKQFQIGDYLDVAISEPPREPRGFIPDGRRISKNSLQINGRFHVN